MGRLERSGRSPDFGSSHRVVGRRRLDVLVRGHDGGLAHRRWTADREWGDWEWRGGRLTSGPAAVNWGENRIDVFGDGRAGLDGLGEPGSLSANSADCGTG